MTPTVAMPQHLWKINDLKTKPALDMGGREGPSLIPALPVAPPGPEPSTRLKRYGLCGTLINMTFFLCVSLLYSGIFIDASLLCLARVLLVARSPYNISVFCVARSHFLFPWSNSFAVGYIVWLRCTASQTDGQTVRRHHHANSRSYC